MLWIPTFRWSRARQGRGARQAARGSERSRYRSKGGGMSDVEVELSQVNIALTNDTLKSTLARLRTSCRHAFPDNSSIVLVYNHAKLQPFV